MSPLLKWGYQLAANSAFALPQAWFYLLVERFDLLEEGFHRLEERFHLPEAPSVPSDHSFALLEGPSNRPNPSSDPVEASASDPDHSSPPANLSYEPANDFDINGNHLFHRAKPCIWFVDKASINLKEPNV